MSQVLLGDLNTYLDFEWPADVLTEPAAHWFAAATASPNPCAAAVAAAAASEGPWQGRAVGAAGDATSAAPTPPPPPFVDAWSASHGAEAGWTFPNTETGDLSPARCDRILLRSEALRVREAVVLGCQPIDGRGLYPSDHRMVVADFVPA